jgi:protein CpxP
MAHFRLITPLARTLAIASLAGTTLLAGTAVAQVSDQSKNKPPAAEAATSNKPETVEQRITTLKTALKITPDQETKWNGVAQAMRDNASKMEKLVATKRAIPPEKTTAVDDLKTYQEFTQVRLDGLKNLTSAFKSLYDSMTPDQKKNADQVFERYVPPKPAGQG